MQKQQHLVNFIRALPAIWHLFINVVRKRAAGTYDATEHDRFSAEAFKLAKRIGGEEE